MWKNLSISLLKNLNHQTRSRLLSNLQQTRFIFLIFFFYFLNKLYYILLAGSLPLITHGQLSWLLPQLKQFTASLPCDATAIFHFFLNTLVLRFISTTLQETLWKLVRSLFVWPWVLLLGFSFVIKQIMWSLAAIVAASGTPNSLLKKLH
ncbi:hypothetical protein NC651_029972 [Populus alba x Populus x berolinensis]|nr:hypothetical protein NC651_029972 [Populus alba x Populus x berolinensis]